MSRLLVTEHDNLIGLISRPAMTRFLLLEGNECDLPPGEELKTKRPGTLPTGTLAA